MLEHDEATKRSKYTRVREAEHLTGNMITDTVEDAFFEKETLSRVLQQNTYRGGISRTKARPDGEEMREVKLYDQLIMNVMHQAIPHDEAEFARNMEEMEHSYMKLIEATKKYKNTHKIPFSSQGRFRLDLVNRMAKMAAQELAVMRTQATQLREIAMRENKQLSWANVLSGIRGATFDEENMQNRQKGGGGTSELDIYTIHDKKYFFKKDEAFYTPEEEMDRQYLQHCKDKKDKEIYKKIKNLIVMQYGGESAIMEVDREVFDSEARMKAIRTDAEREEIMKGVRQAMDYACKGHGLDFQDRRTQEIFIEVYLKYMPWQTRMDVCKVAGIGSGESLSKRNVLTSRAAVLTHMPGLIAASNMAQVKKSGAGTESGIMMVQARGESYGDLMNRNGKNTEFTPEAIRQFACLQLLDTICGQVDRNSGNFFVTYEEREGKTIITGVQGIDNDMGFGLLKFEKLGERNRELRPIMENGSCILPAVDAEMFEAMRAMDREHLGYFFGDMLQAEYLDALWDRWENTVKLIEKEAETNPRILVKKEDWDADVANRFKSVNSYLGTRRFTVAPNP